jgi:hypothetical protein
LENLREEKTVEDERERGRVENEEERKESRHLRAITSLENPATDSTI